MAVGDIDKNKQSEATSDLNIPHLIYDLSIVDLEERKSKVITKENVQAVAKFLGRSIKYVVNNRTHNKQAVDSKGNFWAIRIDKQTKK